MIGQTVGPYEVVDRLGTGGMGEVYRVRDSRLNRWAALKILSADLTSDPQAVARFEREAKAVAAIDHPNIVTVYSMVEHEGSLFLAMELVEGETLAEAIPRHGLPVEQVFGIAVPLADAVAAAHERGIVHRDLKPGNVMITGEGRVKVLDFGLAKLRPAHAGEIGSDAPTATSPLTRQGTVLGTAPYMSPEQVRGRQADERSDIFALGAVLYEMATGRRAYPGDTAMEASREVLSAHPPPVDRVRPELPHHLARIVSRCLEKEPCRRYQSAADLRNDLDDLAREMDPRTTASHRSGSHRKNRRVSSRLTIGLGAALGLAVALGLVVANWLETSPAEKDGVETAREARIRSLAVLPFDNLMNDPEQDYFVDGMHEALITDLARLGGLRVISRTSAMRYRANTKTVPDIARELDVDAVVEGSVLRAGDRVRITAQLIDGTRDEHLWAASYDRDLEDVLALLSAVARDIAGEIELAVSPDAGGAPLGPAPRVDPDVFELVLRARHSFNQRTPDDLRRSLELARRALELDPDHAPAKAQISAAHLLLGAFGHHPREVAFPAAKSAALEALALDDTLSTAHTALGWVEMYFEWNWHEAAERFRRALELDPNDPYARHGLGDYLCAMGRVDEGLAQVELGYKYDPFSPLTVEPYIAHLVWARRYEEALVQYRKGVELLPSGGGRASARDALWLLGRHREAIEVWKEMLPGPEAAELEAAFDREGGEGLLRWMAERVVSRAERGDAAAMSAAGWLAWAGEVDRTFGWLDRAYDERAPTLFQVRTHPHFDALRGDPRLRDLLERLGLPREPPDDRKPPTRG